MRKRREALTIPLLIGREAWAPSAPDVREAGPRGRARGPRPASARRKGGGRLHASHGENAWREYLSRASPLVRASGGGVTPVPIPNTAVKAPRGDDTAFKSAGKQRGANRFSPGPRGPRKGSGGLFLPRRARRSAGPARRSAEPLGF